MSTRLIEKVAVAIGTSGPWSVERFTVSEAEAKMSGVRAIFSARDYVPPGTYTRLRHEKRGVVMSDTPAEMRDHCEPVIHAKGHVLLNGLGLGMILGAVLRRPDVERVTVVEIDADVISLAAPSYVDPRIEIVHDDAFTHAPPKGIRYGAVWHDIWDDICGDNLEQMTRLKRKYGRRADWQGCWGEAFIRYRRAA